MDTPVPEPPPAVPVCPIAEDLLYEILSHPARRAILRRAALGETCVAGDLTTGGAVPRDAMNKQLQVLAAAGLLQHQVDPRNRRRYCYTLVPGPVLRRTPAGSELDFGYCVLRWN
jgi:DNA-binding transcriptional ArsR family regulator